MKSAIALLYAFAAVFGAPTVCAHATGAASPHEAHDGHHGAHSEADAHGAQQGQMQGGHATTGAENAPAHQAPAHGGCDADCDGGVGCDGCATAASAIVKTERLIPQPPQLETFSLRGDSNLAPPITLDPPPPRRR